MDQQEQIATIARSLGRPAQSLHSLSGQPADTLQKLAEGIDAARQREQALLESAYRQALPGWLYRIIIPRLRRETT